jgi:hypothetical protein
MVNKIKVAMPAINAMANENLEEIHWDEIKQSLNDYFNVDDDLTLKHLLGLDIVNNSDKIV